jgi:hypothetical protein
MRGKTVSWRFPVDTGGHVGAIRPQRTTDSLHTINLERGGGDTSNFLVFIQANWRIVSTPSWLLAQFIGTVVRRSFHDHGQHRECMLTTSVGGTMREITACVTARRELTESRWSPVNNSGWLGYGSTYAWFDSGVIRSLPRTNPDGGGTNFGAERSPAVRVCRAGDLIHLGTLYHGEGHSDELTEQV